MENITKQYTEQFRRNHQRQHRYACLLGVLALLVCLAVFWRLKLVGTAMTNEASCGLQEHTHTDACYTEELICGFSTPETASGEHEHTDACYQRKLVCDLPEHTHTADCYSDAEADTETDADWTASFPQEMLTGDWAQDTVLIAASQMNYTESTRNWQLADDGTRHGYTRYGAWYGSPYGDWNSMFAAFCLHYAGVEDDYLTTENAAGVNAWVVNLNAAGQLVGPAHEAVPGDVVFLGKDGKIESCGIVADAADENGVQMLTVIAGDVDNTVAELTVPADSESVLGYAATADAYAAYKADHPEQDTDTDEDTPEDAEEPADVTTLEGDGTTAAQNDGVDLSQKYTDKNGNKKNYLVKVDGKVENYDKANNTFKTDFDMRFNIPREDLKNNGYKAYFDLPDNIKVTDSLIDTDGNDPAKWGYAQINGQQAAKYHIIKVGDKYRIEVQFEKEFVDSDQAADIIEVPSLAFTAEAGVKKSESDGSIIIKFVDGVECTVPSEDIPYDEDETLDYDINTEKTGEFSLEGKTLTYTATISTKKGTPDPIRVKDTLSNLGNLKVSSCKIVKVEKQVGTNAATAVKPGTVAKGGYEFGVTDNNKEFTLGLKGLDANSQYTIVYKYELADIPDNINQTVKNTLNATATDTKRNETVTKETSKDITISKSVITKNGWDSQNEHKAYWEINVNNAHQNISGLKLTDKMLAQADGKAFSEVKVWKIDESSKEVQITGTPEELGYTIDRNADGTIKSVTFNEVADGKNTYKYYFKYATPYTPGVTDEKIKNSATIGKGDGTGTSTGDVTVNTKKEGKVEKSADVKKQVVDASTGTVTVPWTLTLTPPSSTKTFPAKTELIDTTTGSKHYFTKEQVNAYLAALDGSEFKGCYNNVRVKLVDIKGWKSLDDYDDDAKFEKISVTLTQDVKAEEPVVLKYRTTISTEDISLAAGKTCSNTAKLGDLSSSDSTDVYKVGSEKGKVTGYDNELTIKDTNKDTTFMWYVKVCYPLDGLAHTYTVTDTLPQGIELVNVYAGNSMAKDRIESKQDQRWYWAENGTLTRDTKYGTGNPTKLLTVNPQDSSLTTLGDGRQQVTINVTKPVEFNNKNTGSPYFFVVFECKLSDSVWADAPAKAVTAKIYDNEATVKRDSETNLDKVTNSWKISTDTTRQEAKILDKTGKFSSWDKATATGDINYVLTINPDKQKLLQGDGANGKLQLTDQMDNPGSDIDCVLQLDTVKVYDSETGLELGAGEWRVLNYEQSTHKLELELPDQRTLRLEYTYRVRYNGDQKTDKDVSVTNRAWLEGVTDSSDYQGTETKWEKNNLTINVGQSYAFVKVNADNMSECLQGAKFRLYKYQKDESGAGKFVEVKGDDGLYETNEKGQFYIQRTAGDKTLDYNVAYYVQEEQAPAGYDLPDTPTKYYFYFGDTNEKLYPSCMPDGFKNAAGVYANVVDLGRVSKTEYIKNTKQSVDATIKKVWADGTADDKKTAVQVELWRIAVPQGIWEQFYNPVESLDGKDTVKLHVQNNYNGVSEQYLSYQKGTVVHITLVQDRYDVSKEAGTITFTANDTALKVQHTAYAIKTDKHDQGYDVYEVDVPMNTDVKLEISGTNDAILQKLIFPQDSSIGTSTWSSTAEERLQSLISRYKNTAEQVGATMTVNPDNATMLSYLPQKSGTGDYYIYYVQEHEVDGFTSAVTMSGAKGDRMNYTFTITNTPAADDTPYELPKTGGSGTMPYMAGGIALMAVTLLCGYFKKRKEKEGRQND